MIQLFVTLSDRTHEISARPGETIFRAALRHALAPPFSCVSGYCGECVAVLEEGEVELRENRVLSERQLARRRILTCQAVPRSTQCRVRFEGPASSERDRPPRAGDAPNP